MGWIELGDNFKPGSCEEPLEPTQLSAVTQSGNAWILVLLKDKKATTVKPFNSVAAELEAQHHQQMMIETQAEQVLRERAIIKAVDAPPKPDPVPEEAATDNS